MRGDVDEPAEGDHGEERPDERPERRPVLCTFGQTKVAGLVKSATTVAQRASLRHSDASARASSLNAGRSFDRSSA